MRKRKTLTVLLFSLFSLILFAQDGVTIEGYVFEEGNRGYLNLAKVTIIDPATGMEKGLLTTDKNGIFKCQLPVGKDYELFVEKDLFKQYSQKVSTVGKTAGEKIFVKCQMVRQPGYIFDVTIAEKRKGPDVPTNAITGATIEVYNNSTEETILTLIDHPKQEFKVHFSDGNHYTILIRKKGFFNKRMEAFVNVKGCILCFEGVGEVKPSDVLTEGNTMGTLLANVELDPIVMDEGMLLENIYYEYNSSEITESAAYELDKLINVLSINPALVVELGSHTDSRGEDDYNFKLSSARAKSAVSYIRQKGDIANHRIRYQGYGETQIKNKCKNGVPCSDEAHAKNRRTELKVVGLLDIDPYKNKTLKDIIDAENFEKLLLELQNQEQVRVTGDEVPDFIKQQEEKKEKEEIVEVEKNAELPTEVSDKISEVKESEIISEVKEVISDEPEIAVENEIEKVIEKSVVYAEETVDKKVEEPILATEEFETSTETIIEEVKSAPEEIVSASTPAAVAEEKPAEIKIYAESAVDTPRPAPRAINIPEKYSGYRIEFYNSPYELPGSHEIFYRHGRITLDQTKEGYFSYLLGAFKELKDAEDFLKNILIAQYPNAKVVRYKKGNRSNG